MGKDDAEFGIFPQGGVHCLTDELFFLFPQNVVQIVTAVILSPGVIRRTVFPGVQHQKSGVPPGEEPPGIALFIAPEVAEGIGFGSPQFVVPPEHDQSAFRSGVPLQDRDEILFHACCGITGVDVSPQHQKIALSGAAGFKESPEQFPLAFGFKLTVGSKEEALNIIQIIKKLKKKLKSFFLPPPGAMKLKRELRLIRSGSAGSIMTIRYS